MTVVFDTNVIISALRSSEGASSRLIALVRSGTLRPAVTAPLVFEYADVARRPGKLPHLSASDITGFLDWFVLIASRHKVHFLWRPMLGDPKDDLVLEAAFAARAEYLVTHNTSDFDGAATLGVRVVTPAQLLKLTRTARP